MASKTSKTGVIALRSSIGGHAKWAKVTDRTEATAKPRAAFLAKFYDQTDPALPEEVRLQQAESLRKAHFARLGLASAMARRAKRDGKRAAERDARITATVHPADESTGETA